MCSLFQEKVCVCVCVFVCVCACALLRVFNLQGTLLRLNDGKSAMYVCMVGCLFQRNAIHSYLSFC